jgi:hypothetical protein
LNGYAAAALDVMSTGGLGCFLRQALATPHPGYPSGAAFTRRVSQYPAHASGVDMKPAIAAALVSAVIVAGCAARGVRVAELKDQPTKYATKTISVTGVVTSSWGVPLLPFQVYNVDDGSGEITVVSQSGRVPARGTRVSVKGKVNEFAVFGGRSIGLHLREEDRRIRS